MVGKLLSYGVIPRLALMSFINKKRWNSSTGDDSKPYFR